ncbi:MAG: hypothetical protein MZV63_61195 [Marinilabiliales bacterium]|nr:hypothetical protein [Marinilabiliales bacterium]
MKNLTPVGRILFALPFALFGINHIPDDGLLHRNADIVRPSRGIHNHPDRPDHDSVSVSASLPKSSLRLSTLILAGLLFVFIITIHIPHLMDGSDRTSILIALLKDISLMGGSLMIAGLLLGK